MSIVPHGPDAVDVDRPAPKWRPPRLDNPPLLESDWAVEEEEEEEQGHDAKKKRKRPLSAYQLYVQERFANLPEDEDDGDEDNARAKPTHGQLLATIAREWKLEPEEIRARFVTRANEAKELTREPSPPPTEVDLALKARPRRPTQSAEQKHHAAMRAQIKAAMPGATREQIQQALRDSWHSLSLTEQSAYEAQVHQAQADFVDADTAWHRKYKHILAEVEAADASARRKRTQAKHARREQSEQRKRERARRQEEEERRIEQEKHDKKQKKRRAKKEKKGEAKSKKRSSTPDVAAALDDKARVKKQTPDPPAPPPAPLSRVVDYDALARLFGDDD